MTIIESTVMTIVTLVGAIAFTTEASNSRIGSCALTTPETKNLTVTRTFDAPVESVWKQWSDSDKVRKSWGPKRIEFVLNFSDKDGNKLDPAKIGLPAGIPQDVPHVITFKALGDNKTELTVTEYGYTTDQAVEISKAGLEQCLDKMAESLKN